MARSKLHLEFPAKLDELLRPSATESFPNLKLIEDPSEALKQICSAHGAIHEPYSLILIIDKATTQRMYYPKVFCNTKGMGSQFDGSGVILGDWDWHTSKNAVYTFEFCEHDWDTSGANHIRGWHPQVCRKCGFDASIDSSD